MTPELHDSVFSLLSLFPGTAGKQGQNGENLQSAGQHADGQNDFGKSAVAGVIGRGTHLGKAGADVVKAGQQRGKIGLHIVLIQRQQQLT